MSIRKIKRRVLRAIGSTKLVRLQLDADLLTRLHLACGGNRSQMGAFVRHAIRKYCAQKGSK